MPRTLPAVRRCSFSDLGAVPDLFVDYCTDGAALQDHYAGDWRDPAARRQAAAAAATRPVDRDTLADVLDEQNEAWGAGAATHRNIAALRDPETVAVVTGQQVGLLTGPLYTMYKTITTLQCAERLADETGRTVVPVFWVEGEDHDADEIAHATVLHRNEEVDLRYTGPQTSDDENRGAVGRWVLTEEINDLLDRLDDTLPPSDFKPTVMRHVRAAYAPETTVEDAFAQLLHRLFDGAGIVAMNPDDARLKALTAPLFYRDIDDGETAVARIEAASQDLREAGYHAQVSARPTNLFWLDDDGRYAIDRQDDGAYTLRHDGRTFTKQALLDRLEREPERFSPNVVLRPLMQDRLVPTAAYVAGPGEVSYFAQYRGVYDWAGMAMPLIHPRASVSLVESKVQKVLDKYDLSICDFGSDKERLFQEVVVQSMAVDVDALFSDALREMHQALNALKPQVEDVDATLGSATEAARASVMETMDDLKHKVVRAEKRKHDEIRAQLQKAHANLRPGGVLQERRINVLYFLNKYSLDLLDDLRRVLDTDTSSHQVVEL
jgi:bacillithiol biosynthesis cysteine-adding enzyme BshC